MTLSFLHLLVSWRVLVAPLARCVTFLYVRDKIKKIVSEQGWKPAVNVGWTESAQSAEKFFWSPKN